MDMADLPFEADATHAFQLLALRRLRVAVPSGQDAIRYLGRTHDCDLLVCTEVVPETIERLIEWPARHGVARLAVYSPRPRSLSEQLAARGVDANCYSLLDALQQGQAQAVVGGSA